MLLRITLEKLCIVCRSSDLQNFKLPTSHISQGGIILVYAYQYNMYVISITVYSSYLAGDEAKQLPYKEMQFNCGLQFLQIA